MSATFLKSRIEAVKSAIVEAEQAESDILSGAISSYSLDTGQTRQSVTSFNISELRNYIDSLYNRLSTLEARLYGSGSVTTRPDW